jgi:hypothetical protein
MIDFMILNILKKMEGIKQTGLMEKYFLGLIKIKIGKCKQNMIVILKN